MTVLLVLALRVILILVLLRFLLRFGAAVVTGYRSGRDPAVPAGAAPVELVRDEVCNTFVPRSRALVSEMGGRRAHFCSPACRDRALAARR